MYEERKDQFSLRDVILQILFVILFILILIWLFPTKGDIKKISGGTDIGDALDPLYSQVFNENIKTMKEAAISYYTNSRLPKNVGDKVSMTLGQMMDNKIVLSIIDSNNKQCDKTDSYVEVTKLDDEYELKIYLSCSDATDYIIVHLGCYEYCEGLLCEKEEEKPKTCTKTCNSGYTLMNGNSSDCYCKKNEAPKTCQIKSCDSGYTLMNGNSSNCYCKKNETTPQTCQIKSCDSGYTLMNANSSDCYCKKNDTTVTYLYEYKKEAGCTEWSNWSSDIKYKDSDNLVFGKTKLTWKEALADSPRFEKVGVYAVQDITKPIIRTKYTKYLGTLSVKTCTGYDYYAEKNSSGTTNYYVSGKETLVGEFKYVVAPQDDSYYRYEFVKVDTSLCENNCNSYPRLVYKKYKKAYVSSPSTGNSTLQCNGTETTNIKVYGAELIHDGYEYTNKDVYQYIKYYHYKTCKNYQDESIIWSTSTNDSNLIGKGYVATGNKKTK